MKYREALITVCEAARLMPENRPLRIALRVVDTKIERLRVKEDERLARKRQVELLAEEGRQWRVTAALAALNAPQFVRARP